MSQGVNCLVSRFLIMLKALGRYVNSGDTNVTNEGYYKQKTTWRVIIAHQRLDGSLNIVYIVSNAKGRGTFYCCLEKQLYPGRFSVVLGDIANITFIYNSVNVCGLYGDRCQCRSLYYPTKHSDCP